MTPSLSTSLRAARRSPPCLGGRAGYSREKLPLEYPQTVEVQVAGAPGLNIPGTRPPAAEGDVHDGGNEGEVEDVRGCPPPVDREAQLFETSETVIEQRPDHAHQ